MSSVIPLVGRERELRLLHAAVLGATPSAGVVITGEAGSGKTRLVTALADAVASAGAAVVIGYCLPLSSAIPFLPVVDVLRALADAVGADGDPLLSGALERCPPFVRSELARLLPELSPVGEVVPAPADPMERQRLFDAIRRVLAAAAEVRPLLVVIEDIHWADASTLDLCDYLFAPAHRSGGPIVLTFRPAATGGDRIAAMEARAKLVRVELNPLSWVETAAQIGALLGRAVDDATVDLIFRRTGGHAYYTEQLVSAPAELLDSFIPAGMRSVLLTRVSQLSADARRMLAVLALAARPLDEPALAEAAQWPLTRVRVALRGLSDEGYVSTGGESYQLRHALLGEVVVSDLLAGERHELHVAIARALVARSHPAAAEIAYHFAAAGDDLEELRWRVAAAARADDLLAAPDAAGHWLRAINLRPQFPQAAAPPLSELYLRASYSSDHAGQLDDAAALAEQALMTLSPEAGAAHRADVLRLAGHWRSIASPAAGIALLRQAAEIHEALPASPAQVLTLHRIYQLLLRERGGTDDEQRDVLARALQVATACGATGLLRLLTGVLASMSLIARDRADAMRQAELAAAIPPDRNAPATIGAAIYVTEVFLRCGEYRRATKFGLAELRWADDNGHPDSAVAARLRTTVIEALREQGRTVDAVALLPDLMSPTRTAPVDIEAAHLRCLNGSNPNEVDVAELLAEERRRSAALFDREYVSLGVEIHLWAGAPQRAVEVMLPVLDYVATNAISAFAGGLFVLAARACADLADRGRYLDNHDLVRSAMNLDARVSAALERCPRAPFAGDVPATARLNGLAYAAERSRVGGHSDDELWADSAAAWRESGQPHRAGYALYRKAEALLGSPAAHAAASLALREAALLADEHAPLTQAITELAHRARIALAAVPTDGAGPSAPSSPPFGLTARELTVLAHVGGGRTNAQIGQTLFISTSTVGVHVSNILRKLNVNSRVQAAAVAAALGLLDPLRSMSNRSGGPPE